MATIPMGNFGQAVPRPGPVIDVPRGNPIGRELDQLTGGVQQIADNAAALQQRQQAIELHEQQQAAAKAYEASQRAKSIATMATTRDALADAHDELTQAIISGTIPRDKAREEWQKRREQAMSNVGMDLDPDRRGIIVEELNADANKLENGIRKAVTQRDRMDVTANIQTTLESLQRQYRTDPAGATQRAMSMVDQLGPQSTLTPEQQAKLKQGWKESTQYTDAYSRVTQAANSRGGLEAARKALDQFPDLDPQKRATLEGRIDLYMDRLDRKAEAAQRRAEAEADRRMRLAERTVDQVQRLADKGTLLDPAMIDAAMRDTAGTPMQQLIVNMARQSQGSGGIAAMPIPKQQQLLKALDEDIAKNGRNQFNDARRTQVEKVLRGAEADIKNDALSAALERGVVQDVQPIDFTKGVQGIVEQMQARTQAAGRASVWAGAPVSPLFANEAEMFKHQLDSLPAKERAGVIASTAQAIGPDAAKGLAAQLDAKDKALATAFRMQGSMTTGETNMWGKQTIPPRYTSELVLKGGEAKALGTSTKGEKEPDKKPSQWRAFAAAEMSDAFADPRELQAHVDAAELLMHGIATEQAGRLSEADMRRAIGMAVGGTVIDHNNRRTVLPAGVDEDMLDKRLRSVTPEEIGKQAPGGKVRAGGVEMPVSDFVKQLPGQQLLAVRPGQYAVLVGGRPVVNQAGQPVVIGVR